MHRMCATIVMWSVASAALGLQPALTDCPDGRCRVAPPAESTPQHGNTGDLDTRAVARVVNVVGSTRAIGSGTLIGAAEGRGLIVSCAHLFRDGAGSLSVSFPRREPFRAQLLKIDAAADLSALEIVDPGIPPVAVAPVSARPGEPLMSCGYGSDGRLWCNRGQALGYVTTVGAGAAETLELSGSARFGDSGGPVLNGRGQLVAVLYGTDGRVVDGTYCGRVRRFLSDLAPRFCRPPGQMAPPTVDGPTPLAPGKPSQPVPTTPATTPHEALLAEIRRVGTEIEQNWKAISAKLDRIVVSLEHTLGKRDEDATLVPPTVELPGGAGAIDDSTTKIAKAAEPWLVARLTALLVSVGVPGGLAGIVAAGVVYLVMRRGQVRLRAELERLKRMIDSGDSSAGNQASDAERAIVERHHNRYVPYEINELDKAWASAHAHVGEKYPGAIPYLKMVEGVKDQLLSGLRDASTT